MRKTGNRAARLQDEIWGAIGRRRQHNAHPRAEAHRRTADGIVFDSILEKDRYLMLRDLQRKGKIEKLQLQPTFRCVVADIEICKYSPDFSYIETENGKLHVEDVKGFKKSKKTGKLLPRVNREFGIKRKLMIALFGIVVDVV